MPKYMEITPSKAKGKKWKAQFYHFIDGKKKIIKTTNFGDSSAQDYTQHGDKERREKYRSRHAKDLRTKDPMRAGYLSYYILWGASKDIKKNISAYKKRFNFK